MNKPLGAFTGRLEFINASSVDVSIDHMTNVTLTSSDETIATVSLDPSGTFSGSGIKAGTITLSLSSLNDKGASITASVEITFTSVDTTAVAGFIHID